MSSILDALRKSDDKRQQGNRKGVDQIQFGEAKPVKKSGKVFYALTLLLLVVAATVWAYQEGYMGSVKAMFTDDAIPQEMTATEKTKIKKVHSKNQTEKSNPIVKPEVLTLTPPEPNKIKEQIKGQNKKQTVKTKKTSKENKLNTTEENRRNLEKIAVVEKRSKPESRLVIDGESVVEKRDKSKKSDTMADGSNMATISEIEKAPKKRRNKKQGQNGKQAYLLFHQLPYETRIQIPELKINVHVFDPEPENRMVVINGVSFQVGDSIEEIAMVQDITLDGVVIDVSGTVFMLPK